MPDQDDRLAHVERKLAVVETRIGGMASDLEAIDKAQRQQESEITKIGGNLTRFSDRFERAWSDARNELTTIAKDYEETKRALVELSSKLQTAILQIQTENDRLVRRVLVGVIMTLIALLAGAVFSGAKF